MSRETTTIRMDKDLYLALKEQARLERTSVANMLRRLLTVGLAQEVNINE